MFESGRDKAIISKLKCYILRVWVYIYILSREREREREDDD